MTKVQVKNASAVDPLHYYALAYRDYIAARTLLLQAQYLPAATLASTCLEKYIKCILATLGIRVNLHLDRLSQFRTVLVSRGITLLSEVDQDFLAILSSAYVLRYYDAVDRTIFSFHQWQFLAELDATVALIESRLALKNKAGATIKTYYALAREKGDSAILEENFVLLGRDKREYMQRNGQIVAVEIDPTKEELYTVMNNLAPMAYEGRMLTVREIRIDTPASQE